MPSESKVPAAAVGSSSGSGDALEEVTIDVQQIDTQEPQDLSTSVMQMEQAEQEPQSQSVTSNDVQQMTSAAARSNNNEPSTPQQKAPSRSTRYAQHHHSPLTKVNGKGLWRSWKRNFQSKLLALMDLIDNSLDAAVMDTDSGGCSSSSNSNIDTSSSCQKNDFIGRVHVYPDVLHETPTTSTSTTNTPSSTTTTGIILINNSHTSIRPLQQILEVYNSSKTHSGSSHIGENGVGLKQGAATLSDLTFVLVKKKKRQRRVSRDGDDGDDSDGEGVIELGLIAESLQREEGCCLPAFTFPNPMMVGNRTLPIYYYHPTTIQLIKQRLQPVSHNMAMDH